MIKELGFDFDTPLKKFSNEAMDVILNGTKEKIRYDHKNSMGKVNSYRHKFEGLYSYIKRYADDTSSETIRNWAESFMTITKCGK